MCYQKWIFFLLGCEVCYSHFEISQLVINRGDQIFRYFELIKCMWLVTKVVACISYCERKRTCILFENNDEKMLTESVIW